MPLLKDIITRFRFMVEGGKLKKVTAATHAAEARLRAATFQARQFSGALNRVSMNIAGLVGIGAITGIVGGLGVGLVRANIEFGNLNARLETLTGSSENAAVAMKQIQDFAATGPNSIQQTTDAYMTLVQRGIEPTIDRMTALGDLAATRASDVGTLMQGAANLVLMGSSRVIEGATGIEFAVRGDKIIAEYRGVRTEIDRTDEALNDYLVSIGKSKAVAGGMAKMSKTLGGRLSNLKDALWQLAVAIGQAGLTDILKGMAEEAIKAADALQAWAKQEGNVSRCCNSNTLCW
jgi:hypothetical protein